METILLLAQDTSNIVDNVAPVAVDTWIPNAGVQFGQNIAYLVAAMLFILGIKKLSSPRTARRGNGLAALGMLLAIVATLYTNHLISFAWIAGAVAVGSVIGLLLATKVQMTSMPQLVGLFNGFGGIASLLVALSEYIRTAKAGEWEAMTFDRGFTLGLGCLIGAVTFTGSIIAVGKLQGTLPGRPVQWPGQLAMNGLGVLTCIVATVWLAIDPSATWTMYVICGVGLILGITLIIPIGGADMPVAICLLNSYSGLAAAMAGFVLAPPNKALMVSGALVGASGIILTVIMCKAMNRSIANVFFAGVGTDDAGAPSAGGHEGGASDKTARSVDPEEFAMLLEDAQKVVIVPGYGMAVAQAQYAVRDLVSKLEANDVEIKFGIHPVAGRMPGHMNVLLAEVDIPYDQLLDLDEINAELEQCDIALVLGANDVVNPAARSDKSSPIYGMPIIDVDKAHTVVVSKRSLRPGYAGVDNPLFYLDNTLMLFGDANVRVKEVTAAIES